MEMNGDLVSVLMWGFLTAFGILAAVGLGYMYHKDKDKRKLMFALAFFFASHTYLPRLYPAWESVWILERLASWSILPVVAAVFIAVLSILLSQENFDKPFKAFLFVLAASIFMVIAPVPFTPEPFLLLGAMGSIAMSVYLYVTRREISVLMFLLSVVCFTIGGLGSVRGLMELSYFSSFIAYVFLFLIFITAKEGVKEGVSSIFALERELKSEKEKFHRLLNLLADPVAIVDRRGKILEVNDRVTELTGYEKEELLGQNFLRTNIVTAKSKAILIKNLAKRMVGMNITPYEIEVVAKDGRKGFAEVNAAKIEYEGKPAALNVFRDITERKRMEERLSALNFYGGKLNAAKSLNEVYELTLDAMKQILGFERAVIMVVDKRNLKMVYQLGEYVEPAITLPLDGTKKGIVVRAANTRKSILVPDVRKDKDYVEGAPSTQSELAIPIAADENVLGVLDVESDRLGAFDEKDMTLLQILASHTATAISNIEKRGEIEKRSNQLVWLMNSSAEMIRSTDLRQRLEKIAEAIRALGWRKVVLYVTDENLEIRSQKDIVTSGLTHEEKELLWSKRQPGLVWRERFGPEHERFKIGEFYHLPWSDSKDLLYAPLSLAEGRIVGILTIDDPLDERQPTKESLATLGLFLHQAAVAIENAQLFQQLNNAKNQVKEYADQLELKVKQRTQELMEAQNKLLTAERLAAIGQLAAMVGHDLRNPLMGIDGATYYLKTKLDSKIDEKTKEMFEIIEKDIEYSNNIITDLIEYSREIRLEKAETHPKSIIAEALSLVKIPESIQVSDLTQSEPKIEVDVDRMKRVFVNLIKNAIDAMPEGGRLTITTKESDDGLEINFTDTGVGMPKETLDKIWTPLFTTKAKGMGLGLSICKRFVEAHEGTISVKSKVGKGTTFTLKIPVKPKIEGGEKAWLNQPEYSLSTTTRA